MGTIICGAASALRRVEGPGRGSRELHCKGQHSCHQRSREDPRVVADLGAFESHGTGQAPDASRLAEEGLARWEVHRSLSKGATCTRAANLQRGGT